MGGVRNAVARACRVLSQAPRKTTPDRPHEAAVEDEDLDALQNRLEAQDEQVFRISAVSGRGLPELTRDLAQAVEAERIRRQQEPLEAESATTASVWEDWE